MWTGRQEQNDQEDQHYTIIWDGGWGVLYVWISQNLCHLLYLSERGGHIRAFRYRISMTSEQPELICLCICGENLRRSTAVRRIPRGARACKPAHLYGNSRLALSLALPFIDDRTFDTRKHRVDERRSPQKQRSKRGCEAGSAGVPWMEPRGSVVVVVDSSLPR